MKYKYTEKEAKKINKYGADVTVYPTDIKTANVSRISVKEGHFQEFKQKKSTFIYYVEKGSGVFYLNDKPTKVETGDMLVIPPMTRIHYFGKLEMVLTVTPQFDPQNEIHVRYVDKNENPLKRTIRKKK